jgi:hypothetical protein
MHRMRKKAYGMGAHARKYVATGRKQYIRDHANGENQTDQDKVKKKIK